MILLPSFTPACFCVWRCFFFFCFPPPLPNFPRERANWNGTTHSEIQLKCFHLQNTKNKKNPLKPDLRAPWQAKRCIKIQLKGVRRLRGTLWKHFKSAKCFIKLCHLYLHFPLVLMKHRIAFHFAFNSAETVSDTGARWQNIISCDAQSSR